MRPMNVHAKRAVAALRSAAVATLGRTIRSLPPFRAVS